jgi:Mg2+ and Co2+ transporter CorA
MSAQIAEATKRDSEAMKTLSILGVVFLPGTFVSVSPNDPRNPVTHS